jgi:hypothetical protein
VVVVLVVMMMVAMVVVVGGSGGGEGGEGGGAGAGGDDDGAGGAGGAGGSGSAVAMDESGGGGGDVIKSGDFYNHNDRNDCKEIVKIRYSSNAPGKVFLVACHCASSSSTNHRYLKVKEKYVKHRVLIIQRKTILCFQVLKGV